MNRRRSDKINRRELRARRDASDVVRRKNAHLIVDGYNLMHVTRFKPANETDGELRRCREGLLSLLAGQLSAKQYASITVVFDSNNAPKHLPDQGKWKHIHAIFARNENSADDLIAKMIRQHASPKQLVVVSSDHRIHVAAGKRVAVLDSEVWFEALLDDKTTNDEVDPDEELPPQKLSETDLAEFKEAMTGPIDLPSDKQESPSTTEFENPFPDGYFDDLDEGDEGL